MSTDEGASPKEQLIEASRRNNTSLLTELLASPPLSSKPTTIASFLNTTTDALGSSALHVAAKYGAYDVLDIILDQEGVEIDGHEKREGDTALHCAVRHCNGLDKSEWDEGRAVVDILIDAGCDPR
jgi:ankyrin repeat protein